MKKAKLLTVLLLVSISYVTNTSVSVAASTQSEPKNIANSHKKNKSAQSSNHQRQMSEKDITECTQLIEKVAQTDKLLQNKTIAPVADNLKKSASVQVFTSSNPAAIAHLTGGAVNLAPANNTPSNHKLATSSAPTTSKQVAKSTIPPGTQIFASDDPEKIAHLTGKITTPLTNSSPQAQAFANKPAVHPRIHLFSPNTPDLVDLQGKSASLASLQKNSAADKSVKPKTRVERKLKKSVHKSVKPAPSGETAAKTEKIMPKSEKSAPAVETNKKAEEPAPKSEKPAPAVETNKKAEEPAPKSEKPAPAVETNKKAEEPAPKSEKPAPAVDTNKNKEEPAPKSEKPAPAVEANKKTEEPAPKFDKPDPVAVANEMPKK
jgi:hypothetical protein